MKTKQFIIILLFTASTLFAQKRTGNLRGSVIDTNTNQPVSYVSVVIKKGTEIQTGDITNEKGLFDIKKIPFGTYTAELQFIGYEDLVKSFTLNATSTTINLGLLKLNPKAESLSEAVVIAETSTVTQKIDRKVINVGKDLTSSGSTASEMLNNVQSVSVDQQTGSISLRGNENVKVLIDGKPSNISSADLLKQIPSSSIKNIELITNPSAKYNPEGMSGIINLVLHKNANLGFNATLNTGLTRGVNTRYNASIDMNFKKGKVNFFANYGYNSGRNDNQGNIFREDNNSKQEFNFDFLPTSHLLKAGADIYINDKNTFSFYTTQNFSDFEFLGATKVYYDDVLSLHSPSKSVSENSEKTYNFNYLLSFDKKEHNLELEANFSSYDSPELGNTKYTVKPENSDLNDYTEDIVNDRKSTLINLDYTNPISDNSKLEIGAELRTNETSNLNDSNQEIFIKNSNGDLELVNKGTSSFSYNRSIYSGYLNYNQSFGKLMMQLGARFEQYDIEGAFSFQNEAPPYKDSLFSIYPSLFFTYNLSEKHQFQLSYSKRVDRPSIQQVNPIREWSTPQVTSVGNPNLIPQFTNSYEFNYTLQHKKGSITFGAFFRDVYDNITRILEIDPLDENKIILTFGNTDRNFRYGFETSINHRFTKWWQANASIDIYTQDESGVANGEELEITNQALNFRINNSFRASKNLKFQLFSMYRGGSKSIQFTSEPMWMVNLGASLTILGGNGTLSARVNDVFDTMKAQFSTENPYPQQGVFQWENRTAYIGFSYRFGSGKNRAKRRKNRDSNEKKGGSGFF